MCTCMRVYVYILHINVYIYVYIRYSLLRVLDAPMVKERKVEENTYRKQLLLNITLRAFNALCKCTYY